MFACEVEGTGAPPTVNCPVTAALPLTVRLPPSESEKALRPLVVESVAKVVCRMGPKTENMPR